MEASLGLLDRLDPGRAGSIGGVFALGRARLIGGRFHDKDHLNIERTEYREV